MTEQKVQKEELKFDVKSFNYKKRLGFGMFIIFFIYYIACAILQTTAFHDVAAIPMFGMPLGFVLSMGIFPVSWIILTIFFILWR